MKFVVLSAVVVALASVSLIFVPVDAKLGGNVEEIHLQGDNDGPYQEQLKRGGYEKGGRATSSLRDGDLNDGEGHRQAQEHVRAPVQVVVVPSKQKHSKRSPRTRPSTKLVPVEVIIKPPSKRPPRTRPPTKLVPVTVIVKPPSKRRPHNNPRPFPRRPRPQNKHRPPTWHYPRNNPKYRWKRDKRGKRGGGNLWR